MASLIPINTDVASSTFGFMLGMKLVIAKRSLSWSDLQMHVVVEPSSLTAILNCMMK